MKYFFFCIVNFCLFLPFLFEYKDIANVRVDSIGSVKFDSFDLTYCEHGSFSELII